MLKEKVGGTSFVKSTTGIYDAKPAASSTNAKKQIDWEKEVSAFLMKYENVSTAELARAAIVYSIRCHVTREAALAEILRKTEFTFPPWLEIKEQKERLRVLFLCVLSLIPSFEPNAFNASYCGKKKPSPERLEKLKRRDEMGRRKKSFLSA